MLATNTPRHADPPHEAHLPYLGNVFAIALGAMKKESNNMPQICS